MTDIKITSFDGGITVSGCVPFDAAKTFDCGQAFLIEADENGELSGTACGKNLRIRQSSPDSFDMLGTTEEEFASLWRNYLDLDADYTSANEAILSCTAESSRDVMKSAIECGSGIRILRQDPWETLVSFIISQNNNIPRIRKILRTLYSQCGRFPTAEDLIAIGEKGLYELKTGFRAKYLSDAARKYLSGDVDFDAIIHSDDYSFCTSELEKICGVGPKVSACVLLFGFHKTDAFPVDVWMKKVIDRHFGGVLDTKAYGTHAGLAQQYLFYYERWVNSAAQ